MSDTTHTIKSENQSFSEKWTLPPWVGFFLITLGIIVFWGFLITQRLPISEIDATIMESISYEDVAPGWASSGIARAILEPWLRWDTVWYLKIAKIGYFQLDKKLAFPPIYPMSIRLLGNLLGEQYLLASLLISWGAFGGACTLLYQRVNQAQGEQSAKNAILILLWFPTAFYFFGGYTESLFLFFALLSWHYAEEEKWIWAGLIGAAATLTKFAGISLFVPFAYMWWKSNSARKYSLRSVALGLIPLVYFGWSAYTVSAYGHSPSDALYQGWGMRLSWPWIGIITALKTMLSQPISTNFYFYFDISAILITLLATLWWLKRKLILKSYLCSAFWGWP